MKTEKIDIYERITRQIIAHMEKGNRPWVRSWNVALSLPQRVTGESYRGINIILLWNVALNLGYRQPRYMTFKQAQELGSHVRKGEKGHLVVKYGTFTPKDAPTTATGNDEQKIPYLKGYTVFNVEQIEGLSEEYYVDETVGNISPEQRIAEAEAFVATTGVRIIHHGHRACYQGGAEDLIIMPPFETFHSPEDYYSTLLHELAHWTGAKTRLDRRQGKKFGDKDYAFEELVAELTACFVSTTLGLCVDVENSAAYLDNWLKGLKSDKHFFLSACSQAQAAADYLLAFRG